MRFLFITEYFPTTDKCDVRGGVEARCYFLARELSKRHNVTVIASREQGLEQDCHEGIRVVRCGPVKAYTQAGSILGRLMFLFAAYRAAKEIEADVIDSQIYVPHVAAAFLKGRRFITIHSVWHAKWVQNIGPVGILGEIIEKWTLGRKWAGIIAVSDSTRQELIACGINPNNVHVVHNGVDIKACRKLQNKKAANPTLICVSRLVAYKKVDILIRAMHILRRSNIRCNIIGCGPEEDRLKSLVYKLDLKNVTFLGHLQCHEDVLSRIKESHILCLPSVFEGFGMVLLEAMACQVPFICTDLPHLREATGGQGGLFFKMNDPGNLAEKINKLINNKKLYSRKTKECSFVEEYDWGTCANKLVQVYK